MMLVGENDASEKSKIFFEKSNILKVVWGSFGGRLGIVWGSFGGRLGVGWGSFGGCLGVVWGMYGGLERG